MSGQIEAVREGMAQACQRCQCAIEAGDLRCAVCGLPVPADRQVTERPTATILRCMNCGAAVSYEVEARAPRCAFCDSVTQIEHPTDPIERPRWIVPFIVSSEQAQGMLRGWLGSRGFFRPSDLASAATLESIRPLWWVAWIFDARALISWTADSNAGAGRAAWAPWSGQQAMDFTRILVPASRGLTEQECWTLTERFDLSRATEQLVGPPGAVCESFDVQRSAARATIAAAIERVAIGCLSGVIPGSRSRNVKVAVLLESLRTDRFALPTYVFNYRYRGKTYRALVHGQDPACVFGEAPYSIAKIAAVVAAIGGALLLILLLLMVGAALFGG
jgi:hypothetical protein